MKPLVVEGLTAQRDGHVLLEQVSCEVKAGQTTGIIAENPDRLNFLLNILGGLEKELSGKLSFSGKSWSLKERLRGVGIARETVALVDSLSVLDNLYLSNNRLHTWFGFIRRGRRRAQARKVLRSLESQVDLGSRLLRVEPHTRVMLDIARVLIQDPHCLVFHSVTRGMSLRQYEAFQTIVKNLKLGGKAVILVPLNADDVRRFVDKLYVLQGNQLFEVEDIRELSDDQLHGFFLGNEKQRYQTSHDPIQRAKQLIQEKVEAEDLDFQDLAKSVGMSYDNFRRRFKSQLGMSPNQFFIATKVERAKELLLFTDLEIKDLAVRLGFADPYYFSRFFKERTGISPLHFRKGDRDLD